jgi:hypothetical protein
LGLTAGRLHDAAPWADDATWHEDAAELRAFPGGRSTLGFLVVLRGRAAAQAAGPVAGNDRAYAASGHQHPPTTWTFRKEGLCLMANARIAPQDSKVIHVVVFMVVVPS